MRNRCFLLIVMIVIVIYIFISRRDAQYTNSQPLASRNDPIGNTFAFQTNPNTTRTTAPPVKHSFTSLQIPIVIFCSYRHQYMSRLIHSLHQIDGLNPNSTCLFACQRSSSVRDEDVTKTIDLIASVKFCKTRTIFTQSKKRNAKEYKLQWYNTVKQAFEGKGIFTLN